VLALSLAVDASAECYPRLDPLAPDTAADAGANDKPAPASLPPPPRGGDGDGETGGGPTTLHRGEKMQLSPDPSLPDTTSSGLAPIGSRNLVSTGCRPDPIHHFHLKIEMVMFHPTKFFST